MAQPMDASYMLHEMCHNVLSQADVKAIGKSRGFSAQEIASPSLLANFYLSPIGVEAVLQSLSRDEITMLHLLKELDREVDVTLFARIYGDAARTRSYFYGTFTQQYKSTFQQVKKSLVRRGVLLMAQSIGGGDTKMERWRFRFPPEFAPYLPPLLATVQRLEEPGDQRTDVLRAQVRKIVAPRSSPAQDAWQLRGGVLFLGEQRFRVAGLQAWQRSRWEATLPPAKPTRRGHDVRGKVRTHTPVEAAIYALSSLGPGEWAAPATLTPVFKVFCDRDLSGKSVCEAGWRWGCLARQEKAGRMFYRLADLQPAGKAEPDPAVYLRSSGDDAVEIDLDAIPYHALETINRLARLEIREGRLRAIPSLIAAGAAPVSLRQDALTLWLRENVPAFGAMWETLEKRWGRHIVHENILLAQVKDLSLKVKIEKSFGNAIISLSDDFIAFPPGLESKVRRLVTQVGYAVKEVRNDERA